MKRFRLLGVLIATPALAAFLSLAGCSGEKEAKPAAQKSDTGSSVGAEAKGGGRPVRGGAKTPLVATTWGSLKGKVTYDGDPPPVEQIVIPDTVKEKDQCLQGDTRKQTWKVGPDKGIGDVVVWLRPTKGHYFQIPADEQKPEPPVVKIDQPQCAFIPHVSTLYPSFYDSESKKQKPTGQVFEVVNSASFNHNTKWDPSDTLVMLGANEILQSKSNRKIDVKVGKDKDAGGEMLLKFSCNIHPWMSAFAWAFDHPYSAVTTGDAKDAKDFGDYQIKRVPAGVELELVCWHESFKDKPKVLKTVTLKDGENTEDFKIK
jgi:hypothetical protein